MVEKEVGIIYITFINGRTFGTIIENEEINSVQDFTKIIMNNKEDMFHNVMIYSSRYSLCYPRWLGFNTKNIVSWHNYRRVKLDND